MKGCFSLIIKTIIAILVFFGLKHLGVIDFIQQKIDEYNSVSIEKNIEKSKDIINLSNIDDEYSVDKTLKILKNRMILIQHNATGQKILIIEPKQGNILTKEDIKGNNIQNKIDKIIKRYKNQVLKFNKIEVTKQGSFEGIGQNIPYVKIKAEISNLPIKDMEGVLGVAEIDNEKNLIIVAINEKNKYSQIITESLFKKIK